MFWIVWRGFSCIFFLAIAPAKNASLHHHLHRKVIFVHCLTNLQVGSQTFPCGGTSMPPWVWQGSKTAFFRKKFSPSLQRYLWLCQRHRTTWNPTVLRPWSQSRLNTKSRWKTPNHPEIDLENFGQFQIFQVKPSDVGTWNYISAGFTQMFMILLNCLGINVVAIGQKKSTPQTRLPWKPWELGPICKIAGTSQCRCTPPQCTEGPRGGGGYKFTNDWAVGKKNMVHLTHLTSNFGWFKTM